MKAGRWCEHCGEMFFRRVSLGGRFCSSECFYKSDLLNSEPIQIDCEHCAETFEVPPSGSERRFCSYECARESCAFGTERIEKRCGQCDETFEVAPCRSDQKYCSQICYGRSIAGENHRNWRGGADNYYGQSWSRQRKRALVRDDFQCVICGIDNDMHREVVGISLDVHHRVPFRSFDSHEEANNLDNLMSVCRDCHQNIEPIAQQRAENSGAGVAR